MRVLVTGASGFIGRAVCARLAAADMEIVRVGRTYGPHVDTVVSLREANEDDVRALIADVAPDAVVHLAGVSTGAAARADLAGAYAVNVNATAVLSYAVACAAPDAHFVLAGSGLAYGASFRDVDAPLTEDAPLRPLDAYATTKAAAETAIEPGVPAAILRFFNVIGPGQSLAFALPAFAKKIAEIERGVRAPVLDTSRLDEARDFVDVADAARAVEGILRHRRKGVFNVASGVTRPMHDVLAEMIALSPAEIAVNETKGEGPPLVARGSSAALHAAIGWRAEVAFTSTLAAILDEHRAAT
jgi:GDP-4-dehydro-6-deoxy-D-mannose reductase